MTRIRNKHKQTNTPLERKVFVGLSGGVDSAVSAYLLKKQGYDVRAVFMKNFSERISINHRCPWKEDRLAAYQVAARLGIPIQTWDFQKEYKKHVVDYLFREYRAGRTPNPDVMCNKFVKFGSFLDRALKSGASLVATGHYARIKRDKSGTSHLLKGVDATKDQSYFLAGLNQDQLGCLMFPLGSKRKLSVRSLAQKIDLPNADRPDSQGICFIGEVSIGDFLRQRIKPRRGDIVTTTGRKIGEHNGVWFYTIGQRRGIDVGGGAPYYVVDKDIQRNRLIVGHENNRALLTKSVIVAQWHWVAGARAFPLTAHAKIRYRQDDQAVIIRKKSNAKVQASFAEQQRAVTPGQVFAVYVNDELVGSGIIA